MRKVMLGMVALAALGLGTMQARVVHAAGTKAVYLSAAVAERTAARVESEAIRCRLTGNDVHALYMSGFPYAASTLAAMSWRSNMAAGYCRQAVSDFAVDAANDGEKGYTALVSLDRAEMNLAAAQETRCGLIHAFATLMESGVDPASAMAPIADTSGQVPVDQWRADALLRALRRTRRVA